MFKADYSIYPFIKRIKKIFMQLLHKGFHHIGKTMPKAPHCENDIRLYYVPISQLISSL